MLYLYCHFVKESGRSYGSGRWTICRDLSFLLMIGVRLVFVWNSSTCAVDRPLSFWPQVGGPKEVADGPKISSFHLWRRLLSFLLRTGGRWVFHLKFNHLRRGPSTFIRTPFEPWICMYDIWKHLVSREVFSALNRQVWKCENGEIKRDKSKIWFTGDDLNSSLGVVLLNDSSKVQTVTTREVPEVNTYFDSLILPNLAPEILLNH